MASPRHFHRHRTSASLKPSTTCTIVFTLLVLCWCPALSLADPAETTLNTIDDMSAVTTRTTIDDLKSLLDGEPIADVSDLKNIDLKQLLEISFVNRSVVHYKDKLKATQASLQTRVKDFIANVRGGGGGSDSQEMYSQDFRDKMNETFYQFVEELQLTPYCLLTLKHIKDELLNKKFWPLRFIDSMEFVPTGLLDGVMSTFGLWEECLSIQSKNENWKAVRGKYCMAKVHLSMLNPAYPEESDHRSHPLAVNKNLEDIDFASLSMYGKKKTLFAKFGQDFDMINNKLKLMQMINLFNGSDFRVGICVPSTCSSLELERAINKFLDPVQNPIRIEIEEQCSVADSPFQVNSHQKFALALVVVLGILVGASTTYEYYVTNFREGKDKNPFDAYLITFSAINNTKDLFEVESCEKRLSVIDTIILFFVSFEFVGRSYVLPVFYGMVNVKRALEGLPKEYFTAKKFFFIRGSSFAACTYILAFSTILAYNLCTYRQYVKPSLKNYLKYVANRWLSLARRLVGPILVVYLLPLFGDGPIWHYFEQLHSRPCQNNWLPSFLFINNFANSIDETCNSPSVILSTMFYLSLLAPFIVALFKYPVLGPVSFILLVIGGSVISLIPKLWLGLPVTPYEISTTTSTAQAKLSFLHYFAGTDQYVVVFVCGLLVGYLIKCKSKMYLGKRPALFALWGGMLLLPFISTHWNEGFKPVEGNFSQFSFVSWFVLSKIMWSAGWGWTMFACCTDRSGPVKDVLSVPLIRPLTKLALGVYLNQYNVLGYRQLTRKEVLPITHYDVLTNDISDIVIAFGISYTFYILIERPMYYWIKIILRIQKEPTKKRFSSFDLENGNRNPIETINLNDMNHAMRL